MRLHLRCCAWALAIMAAAGCTRPTPDAPRSPVPQPTATLTTAAIPTRTPPPTFAPTPSPTLPPTRSAAPSATPGLAPTPLPGATSLIITLKRGLKWSDGTPITARDVAGTYDILWAQNDPVWAFLRDVTARDDRTVEFQLSVPTVWAQHAILRDGVLAPRSQYGWLMEQANDLRKALAPVDAPERRAFLAALNRYNPGTPAVSGPYRVDALNSVPSALALARNSNGYNADKVDFDGVTLYSGDVITAGMLYASNEIDYATVSLPTNAVSELRKLPNMFVPGGRGGFATGLLFNSAAAPLDRREVRQALAYAIDRDAVRLASVGDGGAPVLAMAGFPDALVPQYLPTDAITRLNPYKPDPQRAQSLLRDAGFNRGADGRWRSAAGAPLALELAVPDAYTDWLAAAEDIGAQLTRFGITTTVRAYPAVARDDVLVSGNYQMLFDLTYRASPPHPAASFGAMLAGAANAPEGPAGARGMGWPWQQTLANGAVARVPDLLARCAEGLNIGKPAAACTTLAQVFNDQLPALPLWENTATDAADGESRVVGWLSRDDKMWRQNYVTDNYVALQLINGTLRAAPANRTRQFQSFQPTPALESTSNNPFAANFLGRALGPFAAPLVHVPLFWYSWADGRYIPALAERYDVQ